MTKLQSAETLNRQQSKSPFQRYRSLTWGIGAAGAASILAILLYQQFTRATITTEDAYVAGNVIRITPQVDGALVKLYVDNTAQVASGQTLAELDRTDAELALDSARATLGKTITGLRALQADAAQASALVRQREVELEHVEVDHGQRQAIADSGALTGEDLRHSHDAVVDHEAALAVARAAQSAAAARLGGVPIDQNPDVRLAVAHVRAAALTVIRDRIVAPVSGQVAQRNAEVGQHVGPGNPIMAVVPLDQLWVDANFRETQLRGICRGQKVKLTADVYGRGVVFDGRVQGIEAGSGAAFAVLPPQNATGNWIKVAQRLPVRVELAPDQLRAHPLRIGETMQVAVESSHCSQLLQAAPNLPSNATDVYTRDNSRADAVAANVLAHYLGNAAEDDEVVR